MTVLALLVVCHPNAGGNFFWLWPPKCLRPPKCLLHSSISLAIPGSYFFCAEASQVPASFPNSNSNITGGRDGGSQCILITKLLIQWGYWTQKIHRCHHRISKSSSPLIGCLYSCH